MGIPDYINWGKLGGVEGARAAFANHPFSQGCVLALMFNPSWYAGRIVYDLSPKRINSTLVNTETTDWTGWGLKLDGMAEYVNCGTTTVLNPTSAMSGLVYGRADPRAPERWAIGRDVNGGRSYSFGISVPDETLALQINGAPTIFDQVGQRVWAAGEDMCAVFRGNAGIGWEAYANGILDGSAAWVAPAVTATQTNIGRRSYVSNEGYWNQPIALVMIANIAWPTSWIEEISADPLAPFRRKEIAYFFGAVVAPVPAAARQAVTLGVYQGDT